MIWPNDGRHSSSPSHLFIYLLIDSGSDTNVDDTLMIVRGAKPGKQVSLTENEIRDLCVKSREIFVNQPILLELEAPIKICGMLHLMLDTGRLMRVFV